MRLIRENEGGLQRPSRIAVIDDEPLIRELLEESLREMGHDVSAFSDAVQALQSVRFQAFDVMLTDIKMPGMTGIEFYEKLWSVDRGQAARVVFLTGDLMAAATQTFLEQNDCLYLSKPFRQAELRATLHTLHDRCRNSEAGGAKGRVETPHLRAA